MSVCVWSLCSCAELETSTCLRLQLRLLASQPDARCCAMLLQVALIFVTLLYRMLCIMDYYYYYYYNYYYYY